MTKLPYASAIADTAVPAAVTVYVGLGFADLILTQLALHFGFAEGNPLLAHVQGVGGLEFVKVAATIIVLLVGTIGWQHLAVRRILTVANLGMALLTVYHLCHLYPRLIG